MGLLKVLAIARTGQRGRVLRLGLRFPPQTCILESLLQHVRSGDSASEENYAGGPIK
jgi:hypothetical protein